jgi:phosphoribosylaminoimidazole (AIR) synthetase
MGIGMIVVAPAGRAAEAIRACRQAGIEAVELGEVVEGAGVVIE